MAEDNRHTGPDRTGVGVYSKKGKIKAQEMSGQVTEGFQERERKVKKDKS